MFGSAILIGVVLEGDWGQVSSSKSLQVITVL